MWFFTRFLLCCSSSNAFAPCPLLGLVTRPYGKLSLQLNRRTTSNSVMRITFVFKGYNSNSRGTRMGRKRSEEHTSELQSRGHLVCRLLLEKKKKNVS